MQKPYLEKDVYVAKGAICLGNIHIGEGSSVWFHSTLRADRDSIRIGKRSNIQDNCVVHVDEGFPVEIGDGVTVGHGAVLHGCSIGDNSLIGMGAIVLNGAKIGKNCIIGAGALVTQGMKIEDNTMVLGSPAKPIRPVTEEEIAANKRNAEEYYKEGKDYAEKIIL